VTRGDSHVPAEVVELLELQVDLNLVVLESNQRESKTGVAAEPELERNIESVLRGTLEDLGGCVRLARGAVVVAVLATLG